MTRFGGAATLFLLAGTVEGSANLDVESGVLAYQALAAPAGQINTFTLRLNGDNLELSDNRTGVLLRSHPLATTRRVDIRGADGAINDTLTLDFSSGAFAVPEGVWYDGGAGGYDTLVLAGGTHGTERYDQQNQNDGVITLDGLKIMYSNIEPITDTGPANGLTINFNGDKGETINIIDGEVVGQTQVNSTGYEAINFANITNVTVNAGDGADTITVNNPNRATGLENLIINAGEGNDVIQILQTPAGGAITVDGGGGADRFYVTPSSTNTLTLKGGAPNLPAPGDTLNVDTAGTTDVDVSATFSATGYAGSFTFGNRHPVNFSEFESITPRPDWLSRPIPTLSEWALLLLSLLLGGMGRWFALRRRDSSGTI